MAATITTHFFSRYEASIKTKSLSDSGLAVGKLRPAISGSIFRYSKNVILIFLFAINLSFAQTVEKADELLKAKNIAGAKKEIDDFLLKDANQKNAEGWYLKSKVYVAVSQDDQLGAKVPTARADAFKAMKKYTEMDSKQISLQVDAYKPVNDIYTGFYQFGATNFNNKKYAEAFDGFTNAISVSTFMNEKSWISLKLDENSVLYAGVSAEKLNRSEDAVKYYSLLVDNNIKGEGYAEIYKWVANYYFTKKNTALASKYMSAGQAAYPSDPYWSTIQLDQLKQSGDKSKLFAQYEKVISEMPSDHLYRYNFGVELYQYGYNVDQSKRPADSEAMLKRADAILQEAVKLKPDYYKAQLFAGQIKYNTAVDFLNQIKKVKADTPADTEKLKDLALKSFNNAIPFLLAVENSLGSKSNLSPDELADLKVGLQLIVTIYQQTGVTDKAKEYETKLTKRG
jgi:tetratricopeptide (TPR) repeat protein